MGAQHGSDFGVPFGLSGPTYPRKFSFAEQCAGARRNPSASDVFALLEIPPDALGGERRIRQRVVVINMDAEACKDKEPYKPDLTVL